MKRFPSLLVKIFSFLWLLKLSTFVEALNDNEVVVATREDGKTVVRFLLDADYVYSPPTETTEWWYTISDNSVPFVSVQLVYNAHGHIGGLSTKDSEYLSQLSGDEAMYFLSNHSSWTIPHFDLHFYIWPRETVEEIDDPNTLPASAMYLPANYSCPPVAFEAMMGLHCFDTTKDYSTLDFTRTPEVIYGSYDHHVHFLETMFPNQFLKNVVAHDNYVVDIPQPEQVPFTPFPTKFRFRYNENKNAFVIVVVM